MYPQDTYVSVFQIPQISSFPNVHVHEIGTRLEFFHLFLEQGNLICWIMLAKRRFFYRKGNWDDV
jgi:hypothetical protein